MAYGTVTRFDARRGFGFLSRAGFVSRDDGGTEVFVHHSQVSGESLLGTGDRVKFTLEPHPGGLRAAAVQLVR